jgi:hypothetical protein
MFYVFFKVKRNIGRIADFGNRRKFGDWLKEYANMYDTHVSGVAVIHPSDFRKTLENLKKMNITHIRKDSGNGPDKPICITDIYRGLV